MTVKPGQKGTGLGRKNQAAKSRVVLQKCCKNFKFRETPIKEWSERRDLKHKKGIFFFHKTFNFSCLQL